MTVDLTVPAETELRVWWQTRAAAHFHGDRSERHHLPPGRHQVFVTLRSEEPITGTLRIDPGAVLGRYELYRLEVRELGVSTPGNRPR